MDEKWLSIKNIKNYCLFANLIIYWTGIFNVNVIVFYVFNRCLRSMSYSGLFLSVLCYYAVRVLSVSVCATFRNYELSICHIFLPKDAPPRWRCPLELRKVGCSNPSRDIPKFEK